MNRFNEKHVLVTGGSSGIGLEAAKLFQAEGAYVAVTGRSQGSLAGAQEVLGSSALVLPSDAGRLSDIRALAATLKANWGKLDVLVLNAGTATPGPMELTSEAAFDDAVATNFKGVFFTMQQMLPLMAAGGAIVVTTSITNQLAEKYFSVYAACKAALRSLVAGLAVELHPQGIRVNAVSPGPIDTPMYGRLGLPPEDLQRILEGVVQKSPAKRLGTSADVAKAILFLASDDAAYVVGEELIVDGGMSLL